MLGRSTLVVIIFVLTLLAASVYAGGDPERGKALGDWCSDCHGDDALGDDEIPAIGGMDEAAMFKELMAFKSGERVDEFEDMVETVEEFEEQDLADLAAYFSTLPVAQD